MKVTIICFVVFILGGLCACETAKPVADGYVGPTAILRDSTTAVVGGQCGDFFFLNSYEGKSIDNLYVASIRVNEGSGSVFVRMPKIFRSIPIQTLHLEILGRTHCAAPIMEMTGKTHILYGVLEFAAQPNGDYVITGELSEDHCAVWIADVKTGAQVSAKLLVNGPARQGAFGQTGKVETIPPPVRQ